MEITDKVVVCVNLMDEARRKGIDVNVDRLSKELGVPAVGTAARTGEGLDELVRTIAGVVSGRILTSPKLPAPPTAAKSLVDELTLKIRALYPGLHNARWIAYRLIEGDYKIRQALMSGQLATLGRDEEESLSAPPLEEAPA
jgi:ferrous iron transport protein B